MPLHRRHFQLGAVCAALLGLASCEQSTPTYIDPEYQVGTLHGYVKVAGEPRAVTVGAREFKSPGRVIARTRAGPDGWYLLDLPVDRYRIEIEPGDNGYSSPDTFNVVRVEPWSKRHDLLFGRLVLRLSVPESMQGLGVSAAVSAPRPHAEAVRGSRRATSPTTEFTFEFVEPGTSRISLSLAGSETYWIPGTYDPDMAQPIDVHVDRETIVEASFPLHASISGSVTGSWQLAGIGNPYVEAHGSDGEIIRTGVAADGSYRLHLLIPEPVKVRVWRFGGVEQWIGGSFESATVFDLQAGEHIEGVDLGESGILVHFDGPGAFAEHYARLRITDGRGWEFELDPAAAPIAITNLLPGRYYVHASGACVYTTQPWAAQWYAGASSLDAATPIDLSERQLATITMQLEPGGGIEGRVLFSDPNIWAIRVGVFDTAGTPLCADPQWTEDGKFRFRGLANGDYLVAVTYNGDDRWWYPGTWVQSGATVIHVRDAQTVAGINWHLEPQ
jgi:hypothetical protein